MSREQDKRIAEWMGWTTVRTHMSYDGMWDAEVTLWQLPGGTSQRSSPPGYSTDLDAMAEAEKVVRERGKIGRYIETLMNVLGVNSAMDSMGSIIWECATATAAQRAEALCRVIDNES